MKKYCPPFSPALLAAPLLMALSACGPQLSEEEKEALRLSDERAATLKQLGVPALQAGQWDLQLSVVDIEMGSLSEKRENKLKKRLERRGSGKYCLNSEKAASPPARFFAGGMKDCVFGNFKRNGDKLSVELSCSTGSVGSLEMELTGPVSADGYALAGDMAARLPIVGRVNMKGSITGKYEAAACKPDEKTG